MTRSRYADGLNHSRYFHLILVLYTLILYASSCAHWMLFLPLGITMPLTIFPGMLMLIR